MITPTNVKSTFFAFTRKAAIEAPAAKFSERCLKLCHQTENGLAFCSDAMARLTIQLLRRKYMAVNAASVPTKVQLIETDESGPVTPASLAETNNDRGGVARLKMVCSQRSPRRAHWDFMLRTMTSSRTRTVPTEGPKRRVPAKTNVSDIEMLALTVGSFTESHPQSKHRNASLSHLGSIGCRRTPTTL